MERAMGIEPACETWEAMVRTGFLPYTNLRSEVALRTAPGKHWRNGVAQVAQLRGNSKDVSGCSAAPYEFFSIVRAADAGVRIPFSSARFQTSKHAPSVTSLVARLAPGISDVVFFQFLADPEASLVTNLVREETRRSREATLTYD